MNKKEKKVLKSFDIHESWSSLMLPFFKGEVGNFKEIYKFLKRADERNAKYCPKFHNIFRAFSIPKDSVKVVWMLQDPYPNPRLANGIAMSVPKGMNSPSLDAVKDELFNYYNDITIDTRFDETLELWTKQGVLMLNSALTVGAWSPKSHAHFWEEFIELVLKDLNKQSGLVFIFSGKSAQNFSKFITEENNYIIKTYHPAADKHQKEKKLFVGSGIFEKVNNILEKINGPEYKIKWLKN